MYKYYYVCPKCGQEIEVKKKNLVKREDISKVFYENDYAYLLLSLNGEDYKVLFDIEDVEKINKVRWRIQNSYTDEKPHLQVRGRETSTYKLWLMQRYLLNLEDRQQVVDHINRNPLDNRKSNLRIVSQWENMQNKGYKDKVCGVYFLKNRNLYKAEICFNNERICLGFFKEKKDAVIARLSAEQVYRKIK